MNRQIYFFMFLNKVNPNKKYSNEKKIKVSYKKWKMKRIKST